MTKTATVNQPVSSVSAPSGLRSSEAKALLERYGLNELAANKQRSAWWLLIKQFHSALIYLLLVACILSATLKDISDAAVIAVILFINTGLGFYQELKSQKAIASLQLLVTKQAVVIRDGEQQLIDERFIVPGDLLVIREGDVVSADIVLSSAEDLQVNESALNGESVAVAKDPVLHREVFAGSTVEQGEGIGQVMSTGLNTKLGHIASLSSSTQRITQYEQSLAQFSSFLIKITFITLSVVFIAKLAIDGNVHHLTSLALFMIALSIAVVPEAMPVIATVTLSSGAMKLAKQHVIAKTLSAVEDLGNINVLCSDKTGTLTQNKQTVKQLVADDKELFMRLAIASMESVGSKHHRHLSAFDQAFYDFIPAQIRSYADKVERLEELPFDPLARRRRVLFRDGKLTYLVVIGSPETILEICNHARREEILTELRADGERGLRHLAIAYKLIENHSGKHVDITKNEHQLTFAGYVALWDPLRRSAEKTIETAAALGVTIKILSGDSPEVTGYVARQVGLLAANQPVLTGKDIDKLSDIKLAELASTHHAFARLDPEQKYRIIKVLQLNGNVVGYQGDGINDAPSLKLADVAIAVDHATDVARDSADILLLRSDLGVIVNGIRYGRGIFANINKYIRYTMIGNFGNFFALSALFLLSAQLPLLTLQLLLTNLLGDVPLLAISTDNVDASQLQRPSRYSMHSLILVSMMLGSYTAIFEVLFYAIVRHHSVMVQQTSLYLYLTIIGFVVILAVRDRGHFWRSIKLSLPLKLSFLVIAAIAIGLVYFRPSAKLFGLTPLSLPLLGLIIGLTALYCLFLDQIKVSIYRTGLLGKD